MRLAELLQGIVASFCILGAIVAFCASATIDASEYVAITLILYAFSLALLGIAYIVHKVEVAYRKVYIDACKFKRERDELLHGARA